MLCASLWSIDLTCLFGDCGLYGRLILGFFFCKRRVFLGETNPFVCCLTRAGYCLKAYFFFLGSPVFHLIMDKSLKGLNLWRDMYNSFVIQFFQYDCYVYFLMI